MRYPRCSRACSGGGAAGSRDRRLRCAPHGTPMFLAPVELREAAPQMEMDFLEQVAAYFGIQLISSRDPVERAAISLRCLRVQRILAHPLPRLVAGRRDF
ncbi:Putative hydrogen peroxide-inducible protein activator (fragment) [Candidatus Sulfopaludibacter sp. SbA3]